MFTFVWSFSFKNYLSTSNLTCNTFKWKGKSGNMTILSLTVRIYYFLDSSWFLMVKFLNTICYENWNFVVFFWPAILIMGYNGDLYAESKWCFRILTHVSPDPRIFILTFKQTKNPKALLCTQYSSLQL